MFRTIVVILVILQCVVLSTQFEFTNTFGHCLKQENPNLIKCAGQQAIEALQQFNDVNNFTLADGFVYSKDETVMGRSSPINFLDQDPSDFR
jgi:type IV secretory pathway VirB6-like protein